MKKWYVIQTKMKQERLAIDNLRKQGYQTYTPMFVKSHARRGTLTEVPMPLFGGYMFVRFDIKVDNWKSICHTQGVYKLLTAREHSCHALPKGFIEDLMSRSDDNGVVQESKIIRILREFKVGDELEILDGPFKGFKGICEIVEKNKVDILFCLLGRKNSVRLKKNQVKHAK